MLKQILPLLESLNLCVEINKVNENKTILNISMSSKITLEKPEIKKEVKKEIVKNINKEDNHPVVNELEEDDDLFTPDLIPKKKEKVINKIELKEEDDNPFA